MATTSRKKSLDRIAPTTTVHGTTTVCEWFAGMRPHDPRRGLVRRVPLPRFAPGERVRVCGREAVVERVDGPYFLPGGADFATDPYLYRVCEVARPTRYPAAGNDLSRCVA